MHVSMYEKQFRDAFTESLNKLDTEPFEASVKKIVDRLAEDVVDRVHNDVRDRLISAISDSICAKAAEVATRMLEDALAGDEKELRNLFGFYEYPEGSLAWRTGWHPRLGRWRLLDALVERHPDLITGEKIGELKEQVVYLTRERERLHKQCSWWRDKAEGREPGAYP